nr:DUF1974 domain-containing protein [Woeseiaceae bacterium]NIP20273.1 DUF1974 domain-containing protein [Woeseiaceae bacterium]
PGNPLGLLQEALELAEKFAPAEKRLRQAQREGLISSDYLGEQIEEALDCGVIRKREADELRDYHGKVRELLSVDDFTPEELSRSGAAPEPPAEKAAPVAAMRKTAVKTKVSKKTSKKKKSKKT